MQCGVISTVFDAVDLESGCSGKDCFITLCVAFHISDRVEVCTVRRLNNYIYS